MMSNQANDLISASMGQFGGVYSGAATKTPSTNFVFVTIQIITTAVLTCTGNPTGITSISFDAGTVIYGRFTSVVIASGTVILYQGV
jgi:hypothetical protein